MKGGEGMKSTQKYFLATVIIWSVAAVVIILRAAR